MEIKELETLARDIMGRADMLTLATLDGDPYPKVRALFNLRHSRRFPGLAEYQADKGLSIFLGTDSRRSRSVRSAETPGSAFIICCPRNSRASASAARPLWTPLHGRRYGSRAGKCTTLPARTIPITRAENRPGTRAGMERRVAFDLAL